MIPSESRKSYDSAAVSWRKLLHVDVIFEEGLAKKSQKILRYLGNSNWFINFRVMDNATRKYNCFLLIKRGSLGRFKQGDWRTEQGLAFFWTLHSVSHFTKFLELSSSVCS